MSRATASLVAVIGAALLAACAAGPEPGGDTATAAAAPAGDTADDTASGAPAAETATEPAGPATGAARPAGSVPHIYMALQPGGPGHPDSVVFAIDAARDGTPSDDAAIRLTPDAGRCNPQEMRRYAFPAEAAAPVVSEAEAARGLTARDLPRFLAASVTGRLLEAGLADEAEDTRPLNVCTRKLWERLVAAEGRDRAGAQ